MSYKGLDNIIESLSTKLSFSWLEHSYGLTDRVTEMRDDKPYVFPALYASTDGDPVSMMPSDLHKSFSFWTVGDATFEKFEENQLPLMKWDVSLIFYMDISKIHKGYKETRSKIIEDIFNFFNTVHVGCILTPQKFIQDDITKVYDGFTLTDLDNKWKIYPKWCCRMDCEISLRYDCYSSNTY